MTIRSRPINFSTSVEIVVSAPVVSIGQKFERLRVVGPEFRLPDGKSNSRFVVAVCDCGHVGCYRSNKLMIGHVRSCGCLMRETSGKVNFKHGMARDVAAKHPLYAVWASIIQRCENRNHEAWDDYGRRGISICVQWREDFESFFQWAISNGWNPGLEIDRRNNDGNYEPGNCRCADRSTQMNNTRVNRMVTAFGETKTLTQWARDSRCSISDEALRARLNRGMDAEQAISRPHRCKALGLREG